jgi:hypothetical protein
LRAEDNALRRRFLPRLDSHRLGKHIDRDEFTSRLEFPITAQATYVLQESLPRAVVTNKVQLLSPRRRRWHKYVEGFPPARPLEGSRYRAARTKLALARGRAHRAI